MISSNVELFEQFRLTVDVGQTPTRIDKYLAEHLSDVSRTRIQNAAEMGYVLVNGSPVKSNYKTKPSDVIQVMLDHEPLDYTITPENIPLSVVYEDNQLMVINKPAGLVVHPGHGNYEHTLLNGLAYYLQNDSHFDANNPAVGLVHRIDKDTSGLLLIAKTPEAKSKLALQFFNHTTQRTYYALVWGFVKDNEGTIEGALARDNRDRTAYRIYDLEENPLAKPAVTHYRVIERFRYVTLVECHLETGRTHQIRVHMRSVGHPLFSDEKYGGNIMLKGVNTQKYKQFISECFALCPRQALHAKTLGFTHPVTNETLFFNSDLPADFAALIDKWRMYVSEN